MPQPFVLPATAGRTDLLAQAHARSTAVGLRAHERPDFSPLSRLALRELLDTNHALLARPPGDGEPSRADRRHAKPRC